MKIIYKPFLLITLVFTNLIFFINPVASHSFNVTLVFPTPIASSSQARQIHRGFMLATTERDSHPDEHSDGHLGGLDVYVTVIEKTKKIKDDTDIIVIFRSPKNRSHFTKLENEKNTALLFPGQTPFTNGDIPAVTKFIASFKSIYGNKPTADAAQGYNAARRIDVAIRALGEADDKPAIRKSFKKTANDFTW